MSFSCTAVKKSDPQPKEPKCIGWAKGVAKLARAEGQNFESAAWVHKARSMPPEDFKQAIEKELTGRETEPHEIMYFKIYKSHIPVMEQALQNCGPDVGYQQVPRILPDDDRCRLPGWCKS